MKKILGFTSIRSDYDLMSGVYDLLRKDPAVDFRLLVSGAHLSRTFGHTVDLIERDGFPVLGRIESLIDGDSPASRLKTASNFLQSATDIVAGWQPDLLVFAGDREDTLMAATVGTYLQIPSVHFFGGDHEADGHADTAVRHATSKLATAHVVALEEHRQRLVSIGESPRRILVAGSVALDRFLSGHESGELEAALQFPAGKQIAGFALLIFHPVDAQRDLAGTQLECILEELLAAGIPVCAGFPNTDPGNSSIRAVMARYAERKDCWFFANLERTQFLSLYRQARFIIGNSSSGILEAASIPLAAINVGLRQRGRFAGQNVIFCEAESLAVRNAIGQALSIEFQNSIKNMRNPYGDGHSCPKAYRFLVETDFRMLGAKVEDPLAIGRAASALKATDD